VILTQINFELRSCSDPRTVVTLCAEWRLRASKAPAPAENNQRVRGGASRLGSGAWSQG
jgi:hypothetical protein